MTAHYVDELPIPVVTANGFVLVNIPRMTRESFEFFKARLAEYEPAIVRGQEYLDSKAAENEKLNEWLDRQLGRSKEQRWTTGNNGTR